MLALLADSRYLRLLVREECRWTSETQREHETVVAVKSNYRGWETQVLVITRGEVFYCLPDSTMEHVKL